MTLPVVQSSASYNDTTNQTSRTIAKPTGTASGDWLLLSVSIDLTATVTTPTGFTLVRTIADPSGAMSLYIFKRKADGTEGSTFTIASDNEQTAGIIVRISGCDSTDCIDVVSTARGEQGKEPNARCPNAYSITDDALVFRIVGIDGNNTLSTPTSHTLVVYQSGGSSGTALMVAYKSQASAGYTDSAYSTTGSAGEEYCAATVVVRSNTTEVLPDQPVIRCMSYVMPSTGNAIVFDKPYGTVEDDALLMTLVSDSNNFNIDAGFSVIKESNVSTTIYAKMYGRVAGASEGSTYTGTTGSITAAVGVLARIINADTTSPFDQSSVNTGTSTAPASTAITPSNDNSLLINFVGADDDDNTYDANYPSGWTGLISVANQEGADCTYQLSLKTQTTAASTGTVTSALDLSEQWVSILVSIAPAADAGSVGAASGTGAATGTGSSTNKQAGSASGTATASGTGASTATASGSAAGTSTASATGQSVKTGNGASAGTSTASATSSSLFSGVGSSSGVATATAVGASTATSSGASGGVATVSAVGSSLFSGVGSASGTSTATAESSGDITGDGSASGVATATAVAGFLGVSSASAAASAVGVSEFRASGSASGVASVTAVGRTEVHAAGSVSSVAVAAAIGSSIAQGAGAASGVAVASASAGSQGESAGTSSASAFALTGGVGASSGTSTALAVGAATFEAVGSSSGTSTALAVGQGATSGAGSSAGTSTVLGIVGLLGASSGAAVATGVGSSTAEALGEITGVSTVIAFAPVYNEIATTSDIYTEITGEADIYTEIQPSLGSTYTEVA